jgi:hypothetical protein
MAPAAVQRKTLASDSIKAIDKKAVVQLVWDDLLPEQERNAPILAPPPPPTGHYLDESGPAVSQEGSFEINADLDQHTIKLPGFPVPMDRDAKGNVTQFFLVPYFGACIHVPPPPPNQIVYVVMKQPFPLKSMWDPIWVTGRISTHSRSKQGIIAAYSIAGTTMERYVDP